MTGIRSISGVVSSRRVAFHPSRIGKLMSIKTRSGFSVAAMDTPTSPSAAIKTSKPRRRRLRESMSRFISLSSTRKILVMPRPSRPYGARSDCSLIARSTGKENACRLVPDPRKAGAACMIRSLYSTMIFRIRDRWWYNRGRCREGARCGKGRRACSSAWLHARLRRRRNALRQTFARGRSLRAAH